MTLLMSRAAISQLLMSSSAFDTLN